MADPLRNFNFVVELNGISQAGFSECSGFGATTELEEFDEGGRNTGSHKRVGRTKQNNITLKWGITESRELYEWHHDVVFSRIRRMDGSIVLYDLEGVEKARWNFFGAWPTRWDGPSLTATGGEVAIETLELAHERLERVR